ncbi:mitogen-activated protein kinase kinase kinase 3-like [Bidens hawaiensis]|uniref:mitogen-activated protein kinase kinase kinase 3-like n=1 Tax=Bidens hawaiensis TaxID=980011 RepID=UPI004049F702
MPAWWGKKSSTKNKDQHRKNLNQDKPFNSKDTSITSNNKNKSFDDVVVSARSSSFTTPGFSGFDSDPIGLPLPQPPTSPTRSSFAPGSGSVSSSGDSSVSSSDYVQFGILRGSGETRLSPQPRSPGPGSRAATATSPLHPRFAGSGSSLDSPNKNSEWHPLPLPPPGSPTAAATAASRIGSSPCRPSTVTDVGVSEILNLNNQLWKWKKGRLLGRGTFGHVYLGFNSEGGQMCAIKEVKVVSDDQTSKESLKQLNQEITLLSHLLHPNIVQYYGSELGEETLSVYLEYVSGGSIHKLLQEYGPFREPVIQNYTRQVLSGLAYLHGRNTVHRDIKGANILVDPNGEIKLADFGMAKHITNCTSMLSFKGSPYWMAPEVVMNTNGYNLAVDIWSLGCTVLEMATSKPPWGQYKGVAAIFKIGNSKDMPEIPDRLSNNAKSFIKQCLQRDPSLRPTAAKLLEHPFIRDQATSRAANVNLTKEAFPKAFDGSRTPTALEMRANRNTRSFELPTSKGSPRQTITSLPVSPTSSPLRQAYRSGYVSPPHPAYALIGQNSNTLNQVLATPVRSNVLDPWHEVPTTYTPNRSPHRPRILH